MKKMERGENLRNDGTAIDNFIKIAAHPFPGGSR